MGVVDWRAWTAQNGGTLPTAPNPPGTPFQNNQVFPGINPITDLVNGTTSIPTYPNTPTQVNAVDPFGGWQCLQDRQWSDWSGTLHTWPGGPIMRPAIAGLTSP